MGGCANQAECGSQVILENLISTHTMLAPTVVLIDGKIMKGRRRRIFIQRRVAADVLVTNLPKDRLKR